MAIHISHPQVILYWTQLVIGIICIALAGRGYLEGYIQYLIAISCFFTLGNITFLLLYGFATSRPNDGKSLAKLLESIYQVCATVAYCVGLGSTTAPAEYLRHFIGPLTVFVSMNFGAYLFGGLIALTDLLCLNEAQSLQQPQVTENSQGAEEK